MTGTSHILLGMVLALLLVFTFAAEEEGEGNWVSKLDLGPLLSKDTFFPTTKEGFWVITFINPSNSATEDLAELMEEAKVHTEGKKLDTNYAVFDCGADQMFCESIRVRSVPALQILNDGLRQGILQPVVKLFSNGASLWENLLQPIYDDPPVSPATLNKPNPNATPEVVRERRKNEYRNKKMAGRKEL
eukprot:TRINITY_DN13682_c0_g1_i1.p1 TRINITY_DN13682_c0_g1~~TRINITY_DN13682_c0_g1_i1.p1  ORF type:complete len:202 (+),score=47.57 TRINITY_DN13682_c0_g1_i1:41-607(+)